jgi:hypothetical protein
MVEEYYNEGQVRFGVLFREAVEKKSTYLESKVEYEGDSQPDTHDDWAECVVEVAATSLPDESSTHLVHVPSPRGGEDREAGVDDGKSTGDIIVLTRRIVQAEGERRK